MSSQLIAVAAAAGTALLASPYLASLTVTAPDREVTAWWQPRTTYSWTRFIVTAAAAVMLAALAGAAVGLGAAWPAYLALALTGATLAVVDAEHHRLPNRLLTLVAVVGVVLLALAAGIEHRWD